MCINQDEKTKDSYDERSDDYDNYEEYEDDNIHELELCGYPHVIYIEIDDYSLNHIEDLTISNLPNLTELTTGRKTLHDTTSLDLSSIFLLIMN